MTQNGLQTFLFVGLGNPGPQYAMTRHNMGYLVIEEFANKLGWPLKEDRRFNARVAKGCHEGKTIHLILPLTYMNLSGNSVRRYLDYFKLSLPSVIVITDDIALPFGRLRVRDMGSAGGHNGLKSIESNLGTSNYKRLRMGIGHPGELMLADYVLETFNGLERQVLPTFIDRGLEVIQRMLKNSFTQVMNDVNTAPKQEKRTLEPTDLTKPPITGRGE